MKKNVNHKKKWKSNKTSFTGICIGLFMGFLLSIMATMMYMGGQVNTKNFLSAGGVYDFPQKELKSFSQGWTYDEGIDGHWMNTDGALKKYPLNGKEQRWRYLYINIADISAPQLDATICYYGTDKKKIIEQPMVLSTGENIIALYEDIPMLKMGIRILNARGQYVSIESMQIRTAVSGYTPLRMVKIFGAAYSGFILVFVCFLMLRRRYERIIKWEEKIKTALYIPVEILQYVFQIFGDVIGKKTGDKLTVSQKNGMRVLLFSLLFFWSIEGNVMNWSSDRAYFRYHVLICTVLILMIAAVTWEKPLEPVKWKKPLAVSWMCLCVGIMISDLFVSKSISMVGLTLILTGGFFIFVWGNIKNKKNVIYNMLTALEITFFVGTAYCMLFRTKRLAINYNGLFRSADEFSMYSVMMLGVFLTALDRDIRKTLKLKQADASQYTIHITGLAISCYFILRSAYPTGLAAAAIIILLFAVKQLFIMHELWKSVRIILTHMMTGGLIALGVVCMVHISTKYLPHFLDLEVEYKNELLTTGVDDEFKDAFNLLEPGLMDGVKQKEDKELSVVWKNYIRRWNLFGNSQTSIKVFRICTFPENGYIMFAYRYGIFILLPYIIWQICFLHKGVKRYRQKRNKLTGIDTDFWLLTIGISFVAFCIYGNIEAVFGHPLWLCSYLGIGIWFCEDTYVMQAGEMVVKSDRMD